jgi:hypothetical protein
MNKIDRIIVDLTTIDEINAKAKKEAAEAAKEAERMRDEAIKAEAEAANNQKRIEAARKQAEYAKEQEEKAEDAYKELVDDENTDTNNVSRGTNSNPASRDEMINDEADEQEEKTTKKGRGRGIVGFVIGVGITLLALKGCALVKESRSAKILETTAIETTISGESTKDDPKNSTDYNPALDPRYQTTAADETTAVPETTEAESTEAYQPLDDEAFAAIVADYSHMYKDEYDGIINNEDLMKFAAITNIDVLAEDNPELIVELAGDKTKEEFLNDAAKTIGATVMKNFMIWNSEKSTENFVRVSNIVYGSQKESMLKIEEYTDRIAAAVNQNNKDLVNEIVAEFLKDMNNGSLSKLDDGVGFAAQVNIAVIADGIAKDYLNKENFDMFQVLKTSEKYVSNIFTVYDQCGSKAKTKTR